MSTRMQAPPTPLPQTDKHTDGHDYRTPKELKNVGRLLTRTANARPNSAPKAAPLFCNGRLKLLCTISTAALLHTLHVIRFFTLVRRNQLGENDWSGDLPSQGPRGALFSLSATCDEN